MKKTMHILSQRVLSQLARYIVRLCPAFILRSVVGFAVLLSLDACVMEPPLELYDPGQPVETELGTVITDLEVLWEYELEYDWQAEWHYGWDENDMQIFGAWNITEPTAFNVRRYYTGEDADAPHTSVLSNLVYGTRFKAAYKYGYYDLMVWNDVETIDGVQSLHFDETSSLEYVTAFTNQSMVSTQAPSHAPVYSPNYTPGLAFYEPEFLFAGAYDNLHVTDNPADYDYVVDNIWYKHIPLEMTPVTYIYMPQIILHHNYRNLITQIEGSGNLTGMARSVNLKTHITSEDDISVNYLMRMKRGVDYTYPDSTHETVDIIGGRAMTFGLTGCDPFHVTRSSKTYHQIQESPVRNYLEVKMQFYNGMDSTMVFDVTDQVKERYKGGVITIHLDCDTISIPSRTGGSGFDAVVKEIEDVTYEFDMGKKRKSKKQ